MFILAASRCGSGCIDDARDVLVVVLLVGDYGDAAITRIRVLFAYKIRQNITIAVIVYDGE